MIREGWGGWRLTGDDTGGLRRAAFDGGLYGRDGEGGGLGSDVTRQNRRCSGNSHRGLKGFMKASSL